MSGDGYSPEQIEDGARDLVALVRAYNNGSSEGIEVILDNADLRQLAQRFTGAFHELLAHYAMAAGVTGENELHAFVDEHLAAIQAGLTATAPEEELPLPVPLDERINLGPLDPPCKPAASRVTRRDVHRRELTPVQQVVHHRGRQPQLFGRRGNAQQPRAPLHGDLLEPRHDEGRHLRGELRIRGGHRERVGPSRIVSFLDRTAHRHRHLDHPP
jgi:hypothetical protein